MLIADEHWIVRDGLRTLLETHEDMRVVAAVRGADEALAAVERLAPHVAILELSAHRPDGADAAHAILKASPQTGVIFVSLQDSSALIPRALQAGARGYLGRDGDGEELVKAVREVAAGKRYLGGSLADRVFDSLRRPARGALDELTATERDILRLVADGKSNAQVASQLRLSTRTVETYRIRLMRKLALEDLASLVKFAIRHGITSLD